MTSSASTALTHKWLSPTGEDEAAMAYTAAVGLAPSIEWQMQPGEQLALIALLSSLRPKVSIEIGSRYGGSLQVLSQYSDRVISLDIDPTCRDRLGPLFANVEFVTGNSKDTFPPLMKRLEEQESAVGLIFIDGDHSAAGVQADIRGLLDYHPTCPLFVVFHDSFNPAVRHGIRTSPWNTSRHVHAVELDYMSGVLTMTADAYREMWGGLALAVLLPQLRSGRLLVSASKEQLFRIIYRRSAHRIDLPTIVRRLSRKCCRLIGLR
jgi:cephalosporin hydroxylase